MSVQTQVTECVDT